MSATAVSVAVPVPLGRVFDYSVPEALVAYARRGARVRIPFGRRELIGVIVAPPRTLDAPDDALRPIREVLDAAPLLPPELLSLCQWVSDYYHHPLGEVVAMALPPSLRKGAEAVLERAQVCVLTAAGREAMPTLPARNRAQRALLQALLDGPCERAGLEASAATLRLALDQGWIDWAPRPQPAFFPPEAPNPTPEQAAVLDALAVQAAGFQVSLLHGVTGSGKTEIYLRRIAEQVAAGRQVLVLAPEISLTPQLEARFRTRFGERVARFHSGLTERAREQAWLAVREGEVQVVIGTRSAMWLPFARLGLIVVDEEHDPAYKQQDGVRYSARDVAVVRAQKLGIPVVLGSATPSLETLHNAQQGRYAWLKLRRRVHQAAPPPVRILDMRGQPMDHGLSEPLLKAVERHVDAGGQVLLFLNRRGYAPVLMCHRCGWSAPCVHCDAHMTVHQGRGLLVCHHCGAQQPRPAVCPSCGERALMEIGAGTERIEQALSNRFARARVARLDSDRVTSATALQQHLDDIRNGRVQILVGTQILAKGHDFPGLSMVGIVSADQALYGSDFRAIERMGQLITQVSGRAGRGEQPGEVWLQTHEPEHPLLQTLVTRGYDALCEALLLERRESGLPPFAHLALLRAESRERGAALAWLDRVRPLFEPHTDLVVTDPIPSGMERRSGFWRAQLLLIAQQRAPLQRALSQALPQVERVPGARQLRWSLDVDPYDLM